MFYNQLTKTALLGTERGQIDWSKLPWAIQQRKEAILKRESKEEQFLALVALATNYKNAGLEPIVIDIEDNASTETQAYCNKTTTDLLKQCLIEDNHPLLGVWLQKCAAKGWIVSPFFLVKLFEIAKQSLELRALVLKVMGKRGEWLLRHYQPFKYETSAIQSQEDTLLHGTFDERIELLRSLANTNQSIVRQYFMDNWNVASAKEKIAYMTIWKTFVDETDEVFLLSQTNSKAQSVKEAIYELLRLIPNSKINQDFQNILKTVFTKKEDTKLLVFKGLKIEVKLPQTLDAESFKTGIERESTMKSHDNPSFWVHQIIAKTNPNFWQKYFEMTAKDIVELFNKKIETKIFVPALLEATLKFGNHDWAAALLAEGGKANFDLIRLLPLPQKIAECEKLAQNFPNDTMSILLEAGVTEWSAKFSEALMQYYANNVYGLHRGMLKNIIPYIHKDMANFMVSFLNSQNNYHSYWQNLVKEVEELLEQREAINAAFKSEV